MVSGLSGVWFSLFLQGILMSRLHPAILRPSTGQSSESLPWSSLVFPGLPWPPLTFLGLVYRRLSGLRWPSLVLPGLPSPPSSLPSQFVLSIVLHAMRVSNHAIRVFSRTRIRAVSTGHVVLVFSLVFPVLPWLIIH